MLILFEKNKPCFICKYFKCVPQSLSWGKRGFILIVTYLRNFSWTLESSINLFSKKCSVGFLA